MNGESIRVTRSVVLPLAEVEVQVSRSSGPGGQHAQKSETRVVAALSILLNLLSVGAAYGILTLVFLHGIGASFFGFQQVTAIDAWVPCSSSRSSLPSPWTTRCSS